MEVDREELSDLHCALAWLGRHLKNSDGLDMAECQGVGLILGSLSDRVEKMHNA